MSAEKAEHSSKQGASRGGCGGCSFKGMSTAVDDTFVGVRFGEETNLTLCRTGDSIYSRGDAVVIDLETGPAYGKIERSPMPVFKPCQKSSARRIIRKASKEDDLAQERKIKNEFLAKRFCREKAKSLKLEMKISKVDFSLNSRRATFYFTANGRVDFRQLVRDLAQRFSTRVKMVQVGARDEAGLLGGVGICGRTLCCSTWLKDFKPISIQMAKRQKLSLNPSKISGQCGRLLCCLAYEDKIYQKPKKGSRRPPGSGAPGDAARKPSGGPLRSRNPIKRSPLTRETAPPQTAPPQTVPPETSSGNPRSDGPESGPGKSSRRPGGRRPSGRRSGRKPRGPSR